MSERLLVPSVAALAALTFLSIASAQADVLHMGGTRNADGSWSGLASLEMVTVGNPGNAPDTEVMISDKTTGYGAVDHVYQIGKFEVTSAQYVEFLNAVAKTDTYGLYDIDMSWDPYGCQIVRSGTPGNYTYSVAPDRANRPVNKITWGDAVRFCNWLHNGQPTGAQDLTTTEDGAYFINGARQVEALMAVSRKENAKWFLPTEDEWYKAAYHKNDGDTGNYFDYPTTSDSVPGCDMSEATNPGNNANYRDGDYLIGSPYYRTEVGQFGLSDSPYGTFDQGGNILEWNEAIASSSSRALRGGRWNLGASLLHASSRVNIAPSSESISIGFRVACSPALVPGDTNNDGNVDETDAATLAANWGKPGGWNQGDFNHDGVIDAVDASIMAANWGNVVGRESLTLPEPGSIVVLMCCLVSLLHWRRRP